MATAAARKPASGSSRWLLLAGGALVLVAGFLYLRHRSGSSSSAGADANSGTPGMNHATDDAGDQGGASGGSPFPAIVHGTDDGSGSVQPAQDSAPQGSTDESSTTAAATASTPTVQGYSVAPGAALASAPSAPGSDYITGGVQSHPGADTLAAGGYVTPNYAALAPSAGNTRRPGFQVE